MTLRVVEFSVTYTSVYDVIAEPPISVDAGHSRPMLYPVRELATSLRVAGAAGSPPNLNDTESL